MSNGKHVIQKSTPKGSKKSLLLTAIIAIILCLSVGGTIAYLSTKTSEVANSFTEAHVTCGVVEDFSGGVKKSVKIQNTGNVDAYIRVEVVGNTIDGEGDVTGSFDVSDYLCGQGWWQGTDGYYYWTAKVAPKGQENDMTGELLTGSIDLVGKQVTILAEAIQSEPAAALEAAHWGYTPSAN